MILRILALASVAAALLPVAGAQAKPRIYAYISVEEVVRDEGTLSIRDVKKLDKGSYCVLVDKPSSDFDWRNLPVMAVNAGPDYDVAITATTGFATDCDKFESDRRFPIQVVIVNVKGALRDGDFSLFAP